MNRFSSLYGCLATTLDKDLNLLDASYIFDERFSVRDQERVEKAAQQVLDELQRKSHPPRRG